MSEEHNIAVFDSIDRIDATQWDALCPDDQPFISHQFLSALEQFQCAGAATGWLPRHLALHTNDGDLIAAMPLYLKDHSWGEFVFDFGWAQAYSRAGRDYYPKLVSMCPFTPVTGRRILSHPDHATAAATILRAAIDLARETQASSLHILYPQAGELELLNHESLITRQDVRFLWTNEGYSSFDDFLSTFSADKRKKIRRERRRIAEQGISVRTIPANQLSDAQWRAVYDLCSATFYRRGHAPYLGLDFFQALAPKMGEQFMVNVATINDQIVGAAIFFCDSTTLYGRYWGGVEGLDCLHFETCYYRGIEYCIERKLDAFDPGTQGEHKLRRGFAPVPTWSAHWLADPDFRSAIADYLSEERAQVDAYMKDLRSHLPFRRKT